MKNTMKNRSIKISKNVEWTTMQRNKKEKICLQKLVQMKVKLKPQRKKSNNIKMHNV